MILRTLMVLAALGSSSLACTFEPSSFNNTGIVVRITKPATVLLNQQTAQMIQAVFRHATYPNITGEKSMNFLGKVAYGLTNIHIADLSIENSDVDLKEDTINIEIQNVSASFKGTLSYGYVGAWWLKLIHLIDFEIESSIDLQINIKLDCEKELVVVDTSDCYLTFHKLILHLQGDKDPGWLKQLFTNFISFTLKLILKSQVCKEINFLAQVLAEFFQDTGENFLRDGDIGVDISLASFPVIKASYVETHHKGLLLYKNYSDSFHGSSEFVPSLLSESRMLCFWFSEHVLSSLIWAAFLDDRLVLTIMGEELKEIFENEELESDQEIVQEIFQGASYDDSLAKVWSLSPPQIILQPKGTVVKSSVAVELSVFSRTEETPLVIYFEKDVTVTIQASYVQKRLVLHLSEAVIEPKTIRCSLDISVNDDTLRHFLEKTITVAGIPEVISRIEPVLTFLINSKGIDLFDIIDPEIITRNGYLILQMDFDFPHHLFHGFLKRNLL
ncbi:cholesteryl ester transfer protein [Heteronotia binoei]|uniref:cholesteryl ester transfer protein n=1 Tax=Heteronotia binoei TaxID=13085 RepID=UPI00292DCF24|nr:cholesteryl ester transfer protein [Heteronotia binoei]